MAYFHGKHDYSKQQVANAQVQDVQVERWLQRLVQEDGDTRQEVRQHANQALRCEQDNDDGQHNGILKRDVNDIRFKYGKYLLEDNNIQNRKLEIRETWKIWVCFDLQLSEQFFVSTTVPLIWFYSVSCPRGRGRKGQKAAAYFKAKDIKMLLSQTDL